MRSNQKGKRIVRPAVILQLPIHPELKELIGRAAEQKGVAMNEWISSLAADALGRPDLAEIPRKPFGRPRKVLKLASR